MSRQRPVYMTDPQIRAAELALIERETNTRAEQGARFALTRARRAAEAGKEATHGTRHR